MTNLDDLIARLGMIALDFLCSVSTATFGVLSLFFVYERIRDHDSFWNIAIIAVWACSMIWTGFRVPILLKALRHE